MLNRIAYRLLLALLFVGLAAPLARAQNEGAAIRKLLQDRDAEIKTLLGTKTTFTDDQREKLKTVINDNIDFEEMGKLALGPHWAKVTPAQQKEFVRVFGEIVRNQSLSNLDIYRAKVTYDDVQVEGAAATVKTTTVYRNTPARVDYRLVRKNNRWLVTDIVLDNVSTAGGYANSFQTVIRKKGFDALMTSLNKKLDKMKASA